MAKIKNRDLRKLGYTDGKMIADLQFVMRKKHPSTEKKEQLKVLENLIDRPQDFIEDVDLKNFAISIQEKNAHSEQDEQKLRERVQGLKVYGREHIEKAAVAQMETAMRLPVTVGGALMPDAHVGYGLPIGGVLATDNAVIPYGVGVDIGCRMCMSVFPLNEDYLKRYHSGLKKDLMEHTAFGAGKGPSVVLDDPIFERTEFNSIPVAQKLRAKARNQIGSSGGGNHFVEFGIIEMLTSENEWNAPAGKYLALLSHSGSRGLGAGIADYFTKLARKICKLPREAQHLAWLSLDTEEGQQYWDAMTLAGDYASACHHHIHRKLTRAVGEKPLFMVENHHNFAWKEQDGNGQEVIVHRKGSTPAGKGVHGIIPSSMTEPGFLVRGKGHIPSFNSAAHGAGRLMSRKKAKESFTKSEVRKLLKRHGVTVFGSGLDEAPQAYKSIHTVMQEQHELVEVLGRFYPKIVRMAED